MEWFKAEEFCEEQSFGIYGELGWVDTIRLTDAGKDAGHLYVMSSSTVKYLATDSLPYAIDTANTILEGFHKAGFEVVA